MSGSSNFHKMALCFSDLSGTVIGFVGDLVITGYNVSCITYVGNGATLLKYWLYEQSVSGTTSLVYMQSGKNLLCMQHGVRNPCQDTVSGPSVMQQNLSESGQCIIGLENINKKNGLFTQYSTHRRANVQTSFTFTVAEVYDHIKS